MFISSVHILELIVNLQQVGISSWGSDDIPGAGVIIFPAQNSNSLLVGALFLTDPFPAFVLGPASPPLPLSPEEIHSGFPTHYHHTSPYASSSRHHQSSSSGPYRTSPPDPSTSGHSQGPFRYVMPRTYSTSSSADSQWPAVKDEEGGTYGPHYPQPS